MAGNHPFSGMSVAIVGAACRLPGAAGLDALDDLLFAAKTAVGPLPQGRWATGLFHHPLPGQPGKTYANAAGCLPRIDGFDPGFFGISAREAAEIDPQQRLLLELAQEALDDAGLPAGQVAGRKMGVYVGGASWDYATLAAGDPASTDSHSMQGIALSSLSNRLSHQYDLHGPSLTVDTACSSSLVALHLACEAIRRGEVEQALVGGVNILLAPHPFIGFARASMLSRNGACRAFDAGADGYVRAEGGGVVVLMPLAAARRQGLPVRGVILASGVNSDGHTNGFSVPSAAAQESLMRQVQARAGISPDEIGYFEAHGTGTPVGDPLEATAIGRAVGQYRRTRLPIGSVKTNLGHLEAASGMAGLMKLLVVLKRREIPASLHFQTPNPNIPFDALNLDVVTTRRTMRVGALGGVVALNSFGFGGTNTHVVLAAAPAPVRAAPAMRTPDVLPPLLLSAAVPEALRELAQDWQDILANTPMQQLPAMLRGAARLRHHHTHRLAVPPGRPDAMAGALEAWQDSPAGTGIESGCAVNGRVVFVFSGNGSQWAGMAQDAITHSSAFRTMLRAVDGALTPKLGWSVAAALRNPDPAGLRDTATAQPLLFAVQVCTVAALRTQGVVADLYVGHSVGEVAAAWASGALDLAQAADVIVVRSQAQQRRHGIGGMAVLGVGQADAAAALAQLDGGGVDLAAVNAARSVTVSGTQAGLARLSAHAAAQGWTYIPLDLDYAFHSGLMDPIQSEITDRLAGLRGAAPQGGLISTVTGQAVTTPSLDAMHWWRNVRAPVLFDAAMAGALALGGRIFIEIGPLPVLQSYLRDASAAAAMPCRVLGSLGRTQARTDPFIAIAVRGHVAGATMQRARTFAGPATPRGLPAYPWQRERFWHAHTAEARDIIDPVQDHPLLGYRRGDGASWFSHPSCATAPWLRDHVVDGAVLLPAAAMLEMALAAARQRDPQALALELRDVVLHHPVTLDEGAARDLTLALAVDGGFSLTSTARVKAGPRTDHVEGQVLTAATPHSLTGQMLAQARAVTTDPAVREIDAPGLYQIAAALHLVYGPQFRSVTRVVLAGEHALADLSAPAPERLAQGYLTDPAVVDGALQALIGVEAGQDFMPTRTTVLPWRFGRVRLLRPGVEVCQAALHLRHRGTRALLADIVLLDGEGQVVLELLECWFAAMRLADAVDPAQRMVWPAWVPSLSQMPPNAALPMPAALSAPAAATPETVVLAQALLEIATSQAAAALPGPIHPDLLPWASQAALTAADDLPSWPEIWRHLLFSVPDAVAEVSLTGTCAHAMPQMLRDGWTSAAALPENMVRQMLFDSPTGAAAMTALADAAADWLADWPADRMLRVARIGLPCPSVTRRLLDAVTARGITACLVVLDGAEALPNQAGVTTAPWPDETCGGCFDLVVGTYPCTAPQQIQRPPGQIAALLAPGGQLLMAEPAVGWLWTLLFGPDRAPQPWQSALRVAGCDRTAATILPAGALWQAELIGATRLPLAVPATTPGAVTLCAPDQDALADALTVLHPGIIRGEQPVADGLTLRLLEDVPSAVLGEHLGMLAAWLSTAPAGARLCLVSRAASPGAGAVAGLLRSLANERPDLVVRHIRLDPIADAANILLRELTEPDQEPEVWHTGAGRLLRRLRRAAPNHGPRLAAGRLEITRPGLLGGLHWNAAPPPMPGHGEVAVAVAAAGLNFRDLMWAQGMLPEEALMHGLSGAALGLECAGRVIAVGAGVTDLAVGDQVIAVAPAALASHVIAARRAVIRLPDGMTPAEGATIPVAFLTAIYALGHLARLAPGEHVLIHGGLGGLGLAAIQYAVHRGAIVHATAGTVQRRQMLELLGVESVFDSRDGSFADALMQATGGRGVDVVLNSLSGGLMERGLDVLAPFGRFIEVGKRDIYGNTKLGLRALRNNISYFAVDADALAAQRPALTAEILAEISALLADGRLRPLPYRRYDSDGVVDAFRQMQRSGHVGKLVVVPPQATAATRTEPPALQVRPDRTYLITGGVEGFGLATARYLARNGAKHLALLGRRGANTPGAATAVAELSALGAAARIYAADAADSAALSATLVRLRAEQPPLAGVFHAAMVLDDGWLRDLSATRFDTVLRPKLMAAEALDRLTRADRLDLFVLFSSITTIIGNPGQGNYVAANAALEALAEQRHAAGLPALAVAWGPIGDAGYLTRAGRVSDALARQLGTAHGEAAAALAALPAMLASGRPVCGLADFAWSSLARQMPALRCLLAELPDDGRPAPEGRAIRAMLADLTPGQAAIHLLDMLTEEIATILKLDRRRVDTDRAITEFGMDSLMAVELRAALEARLEMEIPISALAGGGTLRAMAARLAGMLTDAGRPDALAERIAKYEAPAMIVAAQ